MGTADYVHTALVESEAGLTTALAIREEVFIREQGVPPDLERDGLDTRCRHFLVYTGDRAVGTGRMRPVGDGRVKLERMAVLSPFRNRGIGRQLLDEMLKHAGGDGYDEALLHAQIDAFSFYQRAGFQPVGERFTEAGIEHVEMVRSL